jgi:tetratricopeptide (TPR) repeat protein
VKAGHVAEPAGHPKRRSYLLADRFSNIHYLMRHGRAARSRFDWFVAILRLIFPDQAHADTLARVARQTAECGPEGMRDARDLLHSALSRSESAESRRQLLRATFRESWDKDALNSLSNWIDLAEAKLHLPETDILAYFQQMPTALRKMLGFKPESPQWWFDLTEFLEGKAAWLLAEAAYRKSIDLDSENAAPWNNLGRVLQTHLDRPVEAETAYRRAIELLPESPVSWGNLGTLLQDYLSRPVEAEIAYRKAIELDRDYGRAWTGLAELLGKRNRSAVEARTCAIKGLVLEPEYFFAREIFKLRCGDQSDDWRAVLPNLATWCVGHPKATDVFEFTLDGFIRFARLTKPAEALALLNSAPEAAVPFETLRDAFLAHADRNHLDRLAPERRVVVIELLKRISAEGAAAAAVPAG